ncbi:MAG: lanthionine synthetase LanC family protein [Pseudomonadota bacterium]
MVRVTDPETFVWAGKVHAIEHQAERNEFSSRREELKQSLASKLYREFYCGMSAVRRPAARAQTRLKSDPTLERSFASIVGTCLTVSANWHLTRDDTGALVAEKDGLRIHPSLGFSDSPDGDTGVCLVNLPSAYLNLSPGFFYVTGNKSLDKEVFRNLFRIYLNATEAGSATIMGVVFEALHASIIPFHLKAANRREHYERTDNIVLYFQVADFDAVKEIMRRVYPEISGHLRPGVPALTKSQAPGIAIAEDPRGNSFGLSRCSLIAEGFISAAEHQLIADHDINSEIKRVFKSSGLSTSRPYLNAGSTDIYELGLPKARPNQGRVKASGTKPDVPDTNCRNVAIEIGEWICRKAITNRGRATWLGLSYKQHSHSSEDHILTTSTLGASIYSGVSGIAIFLAKLYRVTEIARFRDLARRAARQAIYLANKKSQQTASGLYEGTSGVAFAAALVGCLIDDERLTEAAIRLARQEAKEHKRRMHDIIGGSAGAIVAYLGISYLTKTTDLADAAHALGAQLCDLARWSDDMCSWPDAGEPAAKGLLGFSHGAAGIAYALLELIERTGDNGYRDFVEAAFLFENSFFSEAEHNWPDFRGDDIDLGAGGKQNTYQTAWCHGAPGIGLARLRAFEVLQRPQDRIDVLHALKSTRLSLSRAPDHNTESLSLCHGLSGNAWILKRFLNASSFDEFKLAGDDLTRTTGEIIKRYREKAVQGLDNDMGLSPGFMLGRAGIGSFLLHMSAPQLPSFFVAHPLKEFSKLT